MTPLQGTRTSSAPVGAKSGGDGRAARSPLSCALWRGVGGRRPTRRQHGLLGFHQPRDAQHGYPLFLRRLQGEQLQARPTGFHESRDTKHESRLLCFSRNTRRETRPFPHFPRIPPRCPRTGLDLGRPRSKRRSLPLLTPSGLLPPPRTQQEPMFRKENVLDCVDITIGRGRVNQVE